MVNGAFRVRVNPMLLNKEDEAIFLATLDRLAVSLEALGDKTAERGNDPSAAIEAYASAAALVQKTLRWRAILAQPPATSTSHRDTGLDLPKITFQ